MGKASWKRTLALAARGALALTLASQIGISLFDADFRISAAVMLLPVLAFFWPDYPILPTALLAAPMVFLLRCALNLLLLGQTGGLLASFGPEMIFFAAYGLLLALYLKAVPLTPFAFPKILPLAAIDFVANAAEVALRYGAAGFTADTLARLAAVAAGRTLLAGGILLALRSYGISLLLREDANRYRRLLLMTSSLEGELAWLRKNASLIEGTMSEAYGLYERLARREDDEENAQAALRVARDIHDIKKEYLLIVRGMDEALGDEELRGAADRMTLGEIWAVVAPAIERTAKDKGVRALLRLEAEDSRPTRHHHAVMAILHNLLGNAVEAAEPEGEAVVTLRQTRAGGSIVLTVEDNSGGIDPEMMERIFSPGYSTKINFETGEINRGLGLPMVKDLVEQQLGGSIQAENTGGGVRFTIQLPEALVTEGGEGA